MIFILWLLVWLFSILYPFLNGISLIMILEYENHPISSIDLCSQINLLKKIEYIAHTVLVLVLMFFATSTWVALLVNAPLVIYHAITFFNKTYLLDPTELYKEIKNAKRESIIKIIYYVILFGFYLVSFIKAVIDFESSSRSSYT